MMESKAELSLTPQGPEGPFYIPGQPVRSDIREDKNGLPLTIQFNIKDYNKDGSPVTNAEVHVWHADPMGIYSGYLALYPIEEKGISGEQHVEPTDDSSFLRGIQTTNSSGIAEFQTVFPGWYGRRTPHIHFKVKVSDKDCYTGEVYFDNSLADKVYYNVKPYSERETAKKKYNEDDPEFVTHDGDMTKVNLDGDPNTALHGTLDVTISTAT
ncbi:Catechol 1,2-dioxygenase 1 [Orchesella cincta]|uniref:Catechol 1,2-dioxygenase 1 n=1 Tax=Orchesella cincta TaxID=48709 RepID=A0A1D2MTG3_ORCCI|nr:Catechol 1,2-dioxygenase 1 [Orchesella cincta]